MALAIRSAKPEEIEHLRAFEQAIIAAERPYDETLKPDPISYYDLGALIASEDAEVAVAVMEGRLVGSGYAKKKLSRPYTSPKYHAFIGFMYVHPDFRGQSINRKVLEHLYGWARAQGLFEVRLTVYPDNEPAMRAYEKAGFVPHITEMRHQLTGGTPD